MNGRALLWLGLCVGLAGVLLSGCASWAPGAKAPVSRNQRYARTDLDTLLSFGSLLSEMSEAQQTEVCRDMLEYEQDPGRAGGGLVLHQLLGRLYSPDCGDLNSLMARLDSFPLESLPDVQTRQLVVMQSGLLRRQLQTASVPAAPVAAKPKPKPKPSQTAVSSPRPATKSAAQPSAPRRSSADSEPRPAAPPPGKTGESDERLLRQKLEALRAMERQLDKADASR